MLRKGLKQLRFIRSPRVLYRVLVTEARMRLGIPTLRSVELAVTWRCNKSCPFCYSQDLREAGAKEDIPVELVRDVLAQARELGMVHVNITGGEPLLRKDLVELLEAIPRDVIVSVVTNGRLLTRERIDALKAAGVTSIQMSYGSNYAGDFRRDVAAYAQERGIPVCLSVVNTLEERTYVEEAIRLSEELDCLVLFNYPMKYSLDRETYCRYRQHPNVREDNLFWAGKDRCPAGVEKVYITNDGEVMNCDRIHDVYGNAQAEPLAEIWRRMVERFNTRRRPFCLLEHCVQCPEQPNRVIMDWDSYLEGCYS